MSGGWGRGRRRSGGFEVGWGIARECRGKGYAVEAARASIDWVSRPSRSTRSSIVSSSPTRRHKLSRENWGPGRIV